MKIYNAMTAVMADAEPIAKDRQNKGQGYAFRGIDDVYAALQAVMVKHKVFSLPTVLEQIREERTSKSGGLNIYSILKIKYTFYTDDGSSVEAVVIGEGMDSGDKASNKGMSVAHKYALLQAFAIPTKEAKDPEHDSHDLDPGDKGDSAPPTGKPVPLKAVPDPGDYKFTCGKHSKDGKSMKDLGQHGVDAWLRSMKDLLEEKNEGPAKGKLANDMAAAEAFLSTRSHERGELPRGAK